MYTYKQYYIINHLKNVIMYQKLVKKQASKEQITNDYVQLMRYKNRIYSTF